MKKSLFCTLAISLLFIGLGQSAQAKDSLKCSVYAKVKKVVTFKKNRNKKVSFTTKRLATVMGGHAYGNEVGTGASLQVECRSGMFQLKKIDNRLWFRFNYYRHNNGGVKSCSRGMPKVLVDFSKIMPITSRFSHEYLMKDYAKKLVGITKWSNKSSLRKLRKKRVKLVGLLFKRAFTIKKSKRSRMTNKITDLRSEIKSLKREKVLRSYSYLESIKLICSK